jgi:hypothetical protein
MQSNDLRTFNLSPKTNTRDCTVNEGSRNIQKYAYLSAENPYGWKSIDCCSLMIQRSPEPKKETNRFLKRQTDLNRRSAPKIFNILGFTLFPWRGMKGWVACDVPIKTQVSQKHISSSRPLYKTPERTVSDILQHFTPTDLKKFIRWRAKADKERTDSIIDACLKN